MRVHEPNAHVHGLRIVLRACERCAGYAALLRRAVGIAAPVLCQRPRHRHLALLLHAAAALGRRRGRTRTRARAHAHAHTRTRTRTRTCTHAGTYAQAHASMCSRTGCVLAHVDSDSPTRLVTYRHARIRTPGPVRPVSYTHLRAHETDSYL
eukprot:2351259-Pleurochrysis_carterae.AAC.1